MDADSLHREYPRAREEFHAALLEAVAFHCPEMGRAKLEKEARELLAALASKPS